MTIVIAIIVFRKEVHGGNTGNGSRNDYSGFVDTATGTCQHQNKTGNRKTETRTKETEKRG